MVHTVCDPRDRIRGRGIVQHCATDPPENLDDDEFHLVGTPEQVAEDLERYRKARLEEVVREFIDFPGTTGPELFVEEVAPQFD